MQQRKFIAIILVLLMVCSLMACSDGTETKETQETQTEEQVTKSTNDTESLASETSGERETIVIGFSFRMLDEAMTRWWETTEVIIEEYNEADNPYTIEYYFTNADSDVNTQLSDVESLIVRDPDVICIQCVDAEGSVPAYEAVKAAGIALIDFGFGAQYDECDVVFETINHEYCGQLQAEWINTYLEEHSDEELNIGYIQGSLAVQQMNERYDGFESNLNNERATILSMQAADFDASKAMSIAEDWIQTFPTMNAIVSANDEMCVGGLQAFKTAGISIVALGMDGGENAINEIKEGYMSATISFDFSKIAEKGVEIALAVATGEEVESNINIGEEVTVLIDSDNVADY